MRRLAIQVQTTLDGYLAGPAGEMDWMTLPWSDDVNDCVAAFTATIDHILLGRNLAEGFIPHWASIPADEPREASDFFNSVAKTVISSTLNESPWPGVAVASDLVATVHALKASDGGTIAAYGGATLINSLISANLVDDLYLFVNPTAIASGLPVFPTAGAPHQLTMVDARYFDCGIALLHLRAATA